MTANPPPLLPEVGVLALTYHQWGMQWMTPHHVLTRLAQYFRVVWVNPPHERRDMWKEKRAPAVSRGENVPFADFNVYTPEFWLPKLYRPTWLANFTFDQRLRRALRLLTSRGCQKIILYLWHPEFGRALWSIPFDLSCYHVDDEYSFSESDVPLDVTESRLIATVGQVFVISPGLLEKKGALNCCTTFIPEGVDYQAYSKLVPEPVDIASIPRPRIGYTGMLKKQLDWSLLLSLALRHSSWSFVFVGPRSPHPEIRDTLEQLSRRSNVHFLGGKSVQELTAYPQHFDVCIMPYRTNDYTKYIYPLKLHEYLASGRPVVGSPIRSLQDFAFIIALARTIEEWSQALSDSLTPDASGSVQIEARRSVARQYDWERLVRLIAGTLCDRLGPIYREQLEERLTLSLSEDRKEA